MDKDLLVKVGNRCLKIADDLLEKENIPTAETAGTIKFLIETAAIINTIILNQDEQSRFYGAVARDRS